MFIKILFKKGMSVVGLARFCGVAPCSILAANGCGEAELPGREIIVPVATPALVRRAGEIYAEHGGAITTERVFSAEHIVKPMQTLADIARHYGVSVTELKVFNGIESCFLGQRIYIP
jgi:hypothetical protein